MKIVFSFLLIVSSSLYARFLPMKFIEAKDPNTLLFQYKQTLHRCRSYGVITLQDIYRRDDTTKLCKEKIIKFFQSNPKVKYFASYRLKAMQYYMVELKKEQECVVHTKGEQSYSQALLSQGVGVVRRGFRDTLYDYYFDVAQKNGKLHKRGLWSDPSLMQCIIGVKR